MDIPTIVIPPVQKIETVEIPLPTADVPYYVPLVVPPSDLRDEQGVKPKTTNTEAPPAPKLKIPNLPPIPIPSADILVTTTVAAVTAVAATTVAQPIIEQIKKDAKVNKFSYKGVTRGYIRFYSKSNYFISFMMTIHLLALEDYELQFEKLKATLKKIQLLKGDEHEWYS